MPPSRRSPRPDRDAVRAIVDEHGFFRADEVDVAIELIDERLQRGNSVWITIRVRRIGRCGGRIRLLRPNSLHHASFDLYWIAVDPRFQRQGIGRALMTAVESRIAEARRRADLHRYVGPAAIRADTRLLRASRFSLRCPAGEFLRRGRRPANLRQSAAYALNPGLKAFAPRSRAGKPTPHANLS